MEEATQKGYYLAGYLSYEAGYAFEEKLIEKDRFEFPLLSFGVYPSPSPAPIPTNPCSFIPIPSPPFNLSPEEYYAKIDSIREYIAAGETYQITFCVKKKFGFSGDPYALYNKLLNFQPVPYPAFLSHPQFSILSLSPEMFLKKNGRSITVKPMKGTMDRSLGMLNSLFGGIRLKHDTKNRAENVMIADLLRNDLGRICKMGTVDTLKLFEVARYKTLYQMTSTIRGELFDPALPYYTIFKALFPSGSVTGAPKIRSMQIIRELEGEERKIYTGAIGYITPQRDMFFNVPIRTILLTPDSQLPTHQGEMGIGGGITYYSTPQGEYEECLTKSRFLEIIT